MRDLGQGVGLVHELRELVGAEERIDHRGKRLGIDQVDRGEYLVVAHVHPFTDGAGHTRQADAELGGQLFAYGAHATVGQVVDVVHLALGVDQFDQVLHDGDDVLLGEHLYGQRGVEPQFFVDPVTAYIAQRIAGVREEQFFDDAACGLFIRRFGVAQLPVYVFDGLLFGVGRVFLKGVVNDGIFGAGAVFLVQEDGLHSGIDDLVDVFLFQDGIPVEDLFVTFDGYDLAGIFVHEVFHPGFQYARSQTAADVLLESRFAHFHLLGQVEDVEDVLVAFVTDGAQQGSEGEFLFPVDVGVHHVVDVRGEFHPRPLEGDDARRIKFGSVGVERLPEEYAGRTVQLGDDDAFGSVDHERARRGHVRDGSQVHVLHDGLEVLVIRIGAVQFQAGLQRYAVGQSAFDALLDGVARRIDEIVNKLQYKLVSRVCYGEVLAESLVESFVFSFVRFGFELEEIPERFDLDVQKIGIVDRILHRGKADSGGVNSLGQRNLF